MKRLSFNKRIDAIDYCKGILGQLGVRWHYRVWDNGQDYFCEVWMPLEATQPGSHHLPPDNRITVRFQDCGGGVIQYEAEVHLDPPWDTGIRATVQCQGKSYDLTAAVWHAIKVFNTGMEPLLRVQRSCQLAIMDLVDPGHEYQAQV